MRSAISGLKSSRPPLADALRIVSTATPDICARSASVHSASATPARIWFQVIMVSIMAHSLCDSKCRKKGAQPAIADRAPVCSPRTMQTQARVRIGGPPPPKNSDGPRAQTAWIANTWSALTHDAEADPRHGCSN